MVWKNIDLMATMIAHAFTKSLWFPAMPSLTRIIHPVLLHPFIPSIASLRQNVGDVSGPAETDLQILEEIVVIGRPSIFPVQPGVGRHSLGIGVRSGRHVLVWNAAILHAERLNFAANVFDGAVRAGGSEGEEARDHETAQARPRQHAPRAPTLLPHLYLFSLFFLFKQFFLIGSDFLKFPIIVRDSVSR